MMPVQNYIDIFGQNRALIDKGSAGVMNALRDKAKRLAKTVLGTDPYEKFGH